MILADTSIWIEFFRGKEPVHSRLKTLIEQQNVYAAECVFGELLQGALDTTEQAILSEYWHSLPKLDESGIFIEAGVFSSTNKLTAKGVGLIDTVIMLLARKNGLLLWTLDKKLLGLLKSSEIYKNGPNSR